MNEPNHTGRIIPFNGPIKPETPKEPKPEPKRCQCMNCANTDDQLQCQAPPEERPEVCRECYGASECPDTQCHHYIQDLEHWNTKPVTVAYKGNAVTLTGKAAFVWRQHNAKKKGSLPQKKSGQKKDNTAKAKRKQTKATKKKNRK